MSLFQFSGVHNANSKDFPNYLTKNPDFLIHKGKQEFIKVKNLKKNT